MAKTIKPLVLKPTYKKYEEVVKPAPKPLPKATQKTIKPLPTLDARKLISGPTIPSMYLPTKPKVSYAPYDASRQSNVGTQQLIDASKQVVPTIKTTGSQLGDIAKVGFSEIPKNLLNAARATMQAEQQASVIPKSFYEALTFAPNFSQRLAKSFFPKEVTDVGYKSAIDFLGKGVEGIERYQAPYQANITPNVLSNALTSLPTTAVNLGVSLVNPVAGASLMGAGAFGGATRQAELEMGEDFDPIKSASYGLLSAGAEVATEMPVFASFGKFLKNDVAKSTVGKVFTEFTKNVGKEALQESATEVLQTGAKKITYAPETQLNFKEIVDAGLSGGLASALLLGLGSGVNATVNKAQNIINNKQINKETIQDLVSDIEAEQGQPIENLIEIAPQELQQIKPTQTVMQDIKPLETVEPIQSAQIQPLEPTLPQEVSNLSQEPQKDVVGSNMQDIFNKYEVPQDIKTILETSINNIETVEDIDNVLNQIEQLERTSDPLAMNLQFFAELRDKLQEERTRIRKSLSTFMGSEALPSEFKEKLSKEDFTYTQVSNKDQWDNAILKVNDNPQDTLMNFMAKNSLGGDKGYDTAIGEALFVDLTKKKDFDNANRVAVKLSEMLTDAGQTIQAFSLMKRLTPDGMLYYANKTLNEINKKLPASKKVKLTEAENNAIVDIMSDVNSDNIEGLRQRLLDRGISQKRLDSLSDDKVKDYNVQLAIQTISNKIPADFTEKQRALRRISMLANTLTQVRNISGNVIMGALEDTTQVVSAGIDKFVSLVTNNRETTLPQLKAKAEGSQKGFFDALNDYKLGVDTTKSGGGAYEVGQSKQVFKNQALNNVNNFLSFIMSLGDRPFYQAAYNERIAQLNKLGKEITPEIELQAHEYALEKVFQDTNEITKMASGFKNSLNKIGLRSFGLGDVVLPFTKTPANIMRKGSQYTPLGLITALKSFDKTNQTFNQKQFTDSVARVFVGSSIISLGYLMAKNGFVTGDYDAGDKDREQLETLAGESNYAFKFGDKYYTFDWAQPASIPLAIGIDLYKNGVKGEELSETLEKAVISGGQTLLNQSMLQGLARLTGGYNQTKGLIDTVKQAPTQYVPTALSQIAKTIDPYERKTTTATEKIMLKIPKLREKLPIKLDILGEPIKTNQGRNALNKITENFLLPSKVSKTNQSELVEELLRLTKETSDSSFIPNVAPNSFRDNNITYKLNAENQAKFQKIMGESNKEQMSKLINNPKYQTLSTEEKINLLAKVNEKSYKKAKTELLKDLR